MHYIQPFSSFSRKDLNTISGFINNCIDESMHIVDDIESISSKINSLIYNAYNSKKKNSPIIFDDVQKIDGYSCKSFTFRKTPSILLYGCDCELDLKIINITDDVSSIKELCEKYGSARITRNKNITKEKSTEISFKIEGTIILNNLNMCPYMKSVISHEVRHAFIYYKKFIDKDFDKIVSMDLDTQKWDELYDFCREYINQYNSKNPEYTKLGENNYLIIYSLYSCDKEEIDAFTQAAYDELRNVKNIGFVKSEIKKSNLWNIVELFKEIIGKSNKNEYDKFRNTIGNKIPKYSTFINLIEKRYKSVCNNLSYVLSLLINECEENSIVERYIYHSKSIKGLYIDNSKYYI